VKSKEMEKVMTLHFDEHDLEEMGSDTRLDSINLYDELVTQDDIDADLEHNHVMYGFCTILGSEFEHYANVLEYKLDRWVGKQWYKLKSSIKRKYTDNDAKRKIESTRYYLEQKILISKYRKLSKQLVFGGGKSLEIKAKGLHSRVYREYKALVGNFDIGEDSGRHRDVSKYIKQRLNRKEK
jgi:hypothetical protein